MRGIFFFYEWLILFFVCCFLFFVFGVWSKIDFDWLDLRTYILYMNDEDEDEDEDADEWDWHVLNVIVTWLG